MTLCARPTWAGDKSRNAGESCIAPRRFLSRVQAPVQFFDALDDLGQGCHAQVFHVFAQRFQALQQYHFFVFKYLYFVMFIPMNFLAQCF